MSRRRHKRNRDTESVNNTNNGQQQMNYNNPFGINPNQLLSMFGNIDMNQINNMLQSMSSDGFDLNNLNLGPLQNLMGMGRPNQQQNQANTNIPNVNNMGTMKSDIGKGSGAFTTDEDENIKMLNSLRNIVDVERREFIDKVIKMYNDGAFED